MDLQPWLLLEDVLPLPDRVIKKRKRVAKKKVKRILRREIGSGAGIREATNTPKIKIKTKKKLSQKKSLHGFLKIISSFIFSSCFSIWKFFDAVENEICEEFCRLFYLFWPLEKNIFSYLFWANNFSFKETLLL